MSVKRVYFVRHGETEGNLGRYYQSPASPLTELGHKGAKAVAERFRHIAIDALMASPFVRAQQTAEHISNVLGIPVVTFDPFHELLHPTTVHGVQFNSDEGLAHKKAYKENYVVEDWKPAGAENYYDVLQRVSACTTLLENSNTIIIL